MADRFAGPGEVGERGGQGGDGPDRGAVQPQGCAVAGPGRFGLGRQHVDGREVGEAGDGEGGEFGAGGGDVEGGADPLGGGIEQREPGAGPFELAELLAGRVRVVQDDDDHTGGPAGVPQRPVAHPEAGRDGVARALGAAGGVLAVAPVGEHPAQGGGGAGEGGGLGGAAEQVGAAQSGGGEECRVQVLPAQPLVEHGDTDRGGGEDRAEQIGIVVPVVTAGDRAEPVSYTHL